MQDSVSNQPNTSNTTNVNPPVGTQQTPQSTGQQTAGNPQTQAAQNTPADQLKANPTQPTPTTQNQPPVQQPQDTNKNNETPTSVGGAVVATSSTGGGGNRKIFYLILGGVVALLLIGLVSYLFLQQSRVENDVYMQELTAPQEPVTLPTLAEPTSTPIPTPSVSVQAKTGPCKDVDLQATESAFLASYCAGDYCTNLTTQEDCELVDVVTYASESGQLLPDGEPDGVGDCEWVLDGFSGYCQVRY